MSEMTYLRAISDGLRSEMRDDERVLLMGEDIGVFGGAFKVTELLRTVDKATRELASGDGASGRHAARDYDKARDYLQDYARTLGKLERRRVVKTSIAQVLLGDAAALIAGIDALIGPDRGKGHDHDRGRGHGKD